MLCSSIYVAQRDPGRIAAYLEAELRPELKKEFEGGVLLVSEGYSLLNANRYTTSVLIARREADCELSVITSGAGQGMLLRMNWGTERRKNRRIIQSIVEYCESCGVDYRLAEPGS
jgi:hypothetical protein